MPGAQSPPNRFDDPAHQPWRTKSERSGIVIDTWYGINSIIDDFDTHTFPVRRIPETRAPNRRQLNQMSKIRDTSRMVYIFDGVFRHLHSNGNRLAARHKKNTMTNILFFDGHAASFRHPQPAGRDAGARRRQRVRARADRQTFNSPLL